MKDWADYRAGFLGRYGATCGAAGLVEQYADFESEYAALGSGVAIVDRADRGILEVSGKDRSNWLHNLTTNVVKTLAPGDGKYAFATIVQGRILFDLNVIVRPDNLRLDIARCFFKEAKAHFDKYIIMEDVSLRDCGDAFVLFGVAGDRASEVATTLGVSQMTAMADLGNVEVELNGVSCLFVRNNFCGTAGFDLHVPADAAADVWSAMTDPDGRFRATPAGQQAIEVRRVEAGIPRSGVEITSEYLPAETMQFDRAVSYQKGCYLGQEVIERMRTREKVARRLVRLETAGDVVANCGDVIVHDDSKVGSVTSAVKSIATRRPLALGYVKSAVSDPGTKVVVCNRTGKLDATVSALSADVAVHRA